jgi:hypothetical protein
MLPLPAQCSSIPREAVTVGAIEVAVSEAVLLAIVGEAVLKILTGTKALPSEGIPMTWVMDGSVTWTTLTLWTSIAWMRMDPFKIMTEMLRKEQIFLLLLTDHLRQVQAHSHSQADLVANSVLLSSRRQNQRSPHRNPRYLRNLMPLRNETLKKKIGMITGVVTTIETGIETETEIEIGTAKENGKENGAGTVTVTESPHEVRLQNQHRRDREMIAAILLKGQEWCLECAKSRRL